MVCPDQSGAAGRNCEPITCAPISPNPWPPLRRALCHGESPQRVPSGAKMASPPSFRRGPKAMELRSVTRWETKISASFSHDIPIHPSADCPFHVSTGSRAGLERRASTVMQTKASANAGNMKNMLSYCHCVLDNATFALY